jgi:BirA family biotin operon repressor/biotin-[acetyl-CoA-carboxylase] ligase
MYGEHRAGLRAFLAAELPHRLQTKRVGAEFHWYDSVDSTNRAALDLAERGAPDGTVVAADHQTAGRGRRGRSWVEIAGSSILVSVLMRPGVSVEHHGILALVPGAASARAIRATTGLEAKLKWPNDVFAAGKKLSGTLAENSVKGDRIEYTVLGTGINCNLSPSELPPSAAPRATSLSQLLGRPVSRSALLLRFLEELDALYECFIQGQGQRVLDCWRELSLLTGERVLVDTRTGLLSGSVSGIAEDGRLVIEAGDGCHRVAAGEVTLSSPCRDCQ